MELKSSWNQERIGYLSEPCLSRTWCTLTPGAENSQRADSTFQIVNAIAGLTTAPAETADGS